MVVKGTNRFFKKLFKGRRIPFSRGRMKWKSGYREDLGFSVRSGWEANICRWLSFMGYDFQFESRMFPLSNGKYYIPDFYLPETNTYMELKGREMEKSMNKFFLFQREYPMFNAKLMDSNEYREIEKKYGKHVPNWE